MRQHFFFFFSFCLQKIESVLQEAMLFACVFPGKENKIIIYMEYTMIL